MFYLLLFLFFVVCGLLVWFVLIQEPKQGGLTGGLGGSGGGDLLGGRGVSGGIIRITVILGGLFMALAVLLNLIRL